MTKPFALLHVKKLMFSHVQSLDASVKQAKHSRPDRQWWCVPRLVGSIEATVLATSGIFTLRTDQYLNKCQCSVRVRSIRTVGSKFL